MEAAAASEKEENKRVAVLESSSIDADHDHHHQEAACKDDEIVLKVENGRSQENNEVKSSSPEQKDLSCSKQIPTTTNVKGSSVEPDQSMASTSSSRKDQQDIYKLESARAEMGVVRQENQRLKNYLGRITEDYQTLQMQFYDIKKKTNESKDVPIAAASTDNKNSDQDDESDLVSLSLGSFSSRHKREEKNKNPSTSTSQGNKENHESDRESLSLGLHYKYEAPNKSSSLATPSDQVPVSNASPASSLEEVRKEDAGEPWPPRKVLKTMRSVEDEVGQQSPIKKARVSVRARCDTPTMNDGCQWRKYGQKIAKGNPCPRAYYRCTIAPSCPVRKQVQRCADDMSILITTYEGTHNHPLPMSATAMASTTSAAASMLLSGSSSSTSARSGLNPSLGSTTTTPSHHDIHGYNFYLSDNSKSRFYIPNSSLSSSVPTITLDLTSSNPSTSSNSLSHFNKFSSSSSSNSSHHPTSLNFGSHSESNSNMSWNNNGFLSYGSTQLPPYNVNTNKNQIGPSLGSLGIRQPMQQNNYQSFMHKNINPTLSSSQGFVHHQLQPSDPIAAATKAITADPNFQSALAAALTSIIGSTSSTVGTPGILGNNNSQSSSSSSVGMEKFKSDYILASYFNKQSANNLGNSQPGSSSLMFLPPSLPFSSAPKSASTSPGDTRDRKSL